MRMKPLILSALLAAIPSSLLAAGATDLSGKFNVSEETKVPGMTLTPGSYSIRVLDQLQDRYIVRIDSPSGTHSTFLGVQDPKMSRASTGTVAWSAGADGVVALRGYGFGGGTAVEFVYPKNDAVALAKSNDSKVPAIDPASEGRASEMKSLSKDDMEIVTLWMLSSTQVGPNDTAGPQIKAEKMQQVASATPPKPPISRLPHTGSMLPAALLTGLLAAFGAGMLRMRRPGSDLA